MSVNYTWTIFSIYTEPPRKINYRYVVRAQHKNKQRLKERDRKNNVLVATSNKNRRIWKRDERKWNYTLLNRPEPQLCAISDMTKLKLWHFLLPLLFCWVNTNYSVLVAELQVQYPRGPVFSILRPRKRLYLERHVQ